MVMHAAKHTQDAVNGVLLGRFLPSPPKKGETEEPGADETQQPQTVLCVDAVPLFHSFILPPMMACAFELVEELCQESRRHSPSLRRVREGGERSTAAAAEKSGVNGKKETKQREGTGTDELGEKQANQGELQIVGYYHCNLVTPAADVAPQPSTVAAMAATTVNAKHPQAILCMLQMRRLTEEGSETPAGSGKQARAPDSHVACVYRMQSDKWQPVKETERVVITDAARYVSKSVIRDATYMSLKDMDDHLYDPSLSPSNLSLLTGYEELLEKDREELQSAGINIGEDLGLAGIPV